MRWHKFTPNFYHLILSRSSRNIADSFYLVALSIGLLKVYNIDAGELSLFTLVGLLPNVLSFAYGSILHRLQEDKFWLIVFQISQLVVIVGMIASLALELPVVLMYVLNFLFSLMGVLLGTLQMKIVPATLNDDQELIEKSVDIQYATSNVLDILSNFVGSVLLGFVSYLFLLQLSLPFFIGAIYFIVRLEIPALLTSTADDDDEEEQVSVWESFKTVRESKFASFIITVESFLSGGTDLLLALAPLYLVAEGISVEYLGLVLATHQAADLIGAMLAPYLKVSAKTFFFIDYILSGSAFLLLFILPHPLIKLFLFFVVFVIIGISGNIFEKMIYSEYDHSKLALVFTNNTTLYSIFGILFLLVPFVYSDITVLGIGINGMTILIGLVLFFTFSRKSS